MSKVIVFCEHVSGTVRRASLEARVRDLLAIRHPVLVPVLDYTAVEDDSYIVDDWIDAISLQQLLTWCRENDTAPPHNVYLNLATQICNGLEALHGRPGSATGSENVLHLSLTPEAVFVTATGKVLVGHFGLSPNPTALPKAGASGATPMRMEMTNKQTGERTVLDFADIDYNSGLDESIFEKRQLEKGPPS